MLVKTVKLSEKGQVTLPADALRELGARKGTEFLFIQDGDRMLLVKADAVGRKVLDEFGGWEGLAGPAFEELWGTQADEVWNEA